MTVSLGPDQARQEEVFAFLMDPATHDGAPVTRIDTHAASVFLAGPRALKVKRAVRFPFLDYSTLAKRKKACDEELRVNRPFAPNIYRGVVPVTRRNDGSFVIGGDGTPVEWAVDMARFDERLTLDHVAEAGPLAPDLARDIADAIAASHTVAPAVSAAPWIDSIPVIVARNTAVFRAAGLAAREADALDAASRAAVTRARELLDRRGRQGHVRRCHGDLHLSNLVLISGKPVLFDAIEFDPAIASVDVLYDLAFPLMDLLHYDQVEAANIVLNRYLARTPEDHLDALSLLPLFLSMRAAIRAHVLLARLDQGARDSGGIRRAALDYFALACRLIAPPPPRLIAVGGLSGTGKSVLARALARFVAPQPGAVVLRSDVVRKRLFGVAETERLPAAAYGTETTARVYDGLADRAARILAQGHSVIVDAVFARDAERSQVAAIARDLKLPFTGLFLTADLATRTRRIGSRVGDASDATSDLARQQEDYDIGSLDWTMVDASGTPDETLARSRAALATSSRATPADEPAS
jgi:aminoglycoside phosphotransferase family enzyme/predicted kinase